MLPALTTMLTVASIPGPPAQAAPATMWSNPISPYTRGGYGFGTTVGSRCGYARKHVGIDLKASVGQTVRAAANGKIIGTLFESGVGWAMLIEHNVPDEGTVITRYANITPRPGYGAGRIVSRGEAIATIYNLGSNTHHHFSVRKGAFDRYAWRGYLPARACAGNPAFPGRFVDPTRYIWLHSDTTPPVTSVSATRTVSAVSARWTRGSWRVTLACRDDRSGCARTVYRIDGGSARTGNSFTLDSEGRHTVVFRSYDVRGNAEALRGPAAFGIDRTVPAVALSPPEPVYATGDDVVVTATASDPSSGAPAAASGITKVRFSFCPEAQSVCQSALGVREDGAWVGRPTTALSAGTYRVWAVAHDRAGNTRASEQLAFAVAD